MLINYRPGVPARLRIDYDFLSSIRPDLIYMDVTGFGPRGPWSDEAASDLVAQAYSGAIASEGKIDEYGAPDMIRSLAMGDLVTGLASAMGICAALHHRDLTGEGQLVEAALVRSAMTVLGTVVNREPVTDAQVTAPLMTEVEQLQAAGAGYAEIAKVRADAMFAGIGAAFRLYNSGYVAKDGALVVGALTPENREAMRGVMGVTDDPSADPEFDAMDPANEPKIDAVREHIQKAMRERTVDGLVQAFRAAGAPVAPVNFGEDLADNPQTLLCMLDVEHPLTGQERQIGPIADMSKSPTTIAGPASTLGQHSDELLAEIGYSEEEVAKLRSDAVVF